MKKGITIFLVILVTILVLGIGAWFIGSQAFTIVIPGGAKVTCGEDNDDSIFCEPTGLGGIGGSDGILEITLTHTVDGGSNANSWVGLMCSKLSQVSSETCSSLGPTDPSSTWRAVNTQLVRETLGRQLINIEARDQNGNSYNLCGTCDAPGRSCEIIDTTQEWTTLSAVEMTVLFKEGGYTLDDCAVAEEPQRFYRFEDNACTAVMLLESEVTMNDYPTQSLCLANIEPPEGTVNVYRVVGDTCEVFEIDEDDVLSSDFDSLEECLSSLEGGEDLEEDSIVPVVIAIIIALIILVTVIIVIARRK